MFWENMMLSHWPCFTWRLFMIWFHKILKLIFQMQLLCSRNICLEHWKKLPNLTVFLDIFLNLKNNDSVEHVYKVLLIELFIYFRGRINFSHCIWSIWLFWIVIEIIIFQSVNKNLPNSSCHFRKHEPIFLQILHLSSLPSNITPLYFF